MSLVMEALKERGLLRQNAPHIVHDLPFIVPNYAWWETPFYGIGLKIYDLLAGKYGFGKSRILSREETLQCLPDIRQDGLARRRAIPRRPVRRHTAADPPDRNGRRSRGGGAQLRGGRRPDARPGWLRRRNRRQGAGVGRNADAAGQDRHQRHRDLHRRGQAARTARSDADDQPQPGHPPRFRGVVPSRRQRHHGAAYQRRAGAVRDPLARPHRRRHDRHAGRFPQLRAQTARGGDRIHPRHRLAFPQPAALAQRHTEHLSRASGRWSKPPAPRQAKPRRCRAITPSRSTSQAC